eukprot:IDg19561t1
MFLAQHSKSDALEQLGLLCPSLRRPYLVRAVKSVRNYNLAHKCFWRYVICISPATTLPIGPSTRPTISLFVLPTDALCTFFSSAPPSPPVASTFETSAASSASVASRMSNVKSVRYMLSSVVLLKDGCWSVFLLITISCKWIETFVESTQQKRKEDSSLSREALDLRTIPTGRVCS